MRVSQNHGFTLVEVLVALCLILLGLVPLLRLHVVSVNTTDAARRLALATEIANARLAEAMAGDWQSMDQWGRYDDPLRDQVYTWQARTKERTDIQMGSHNLPDVHGIEVTVSWQEGRQEKEVSVSSLVTSAKPKLSVQETKYVKQ